MSASCLHRRHFLTLAGSTTAGFVAGRHLFAEPPTVKAPRATDGDGRFEPAWDQQLSITVGPTTGDLVGHDDKVLQAAVDYVSRLGGGTVRILPGTFTLRNSVFLPSGLRLIGSGPETIITKHASSTVNLADDSDWYDQEITLESSQGFKLGDGVVLRATNPNGGSKTVIKRTLVAQNGNRFKLNEGLRDNLWLSGRPTCSSLFPLLTSARTANVQIENLALDGNRQNNENLNGNYGGCIFIQDCNRYSFRNVTTRNYNGDGISFQICHDVVVQDCHSHDNADLGLHPGSGSQRPVIMNNRLERNNLGLFWCWGVKYGLAEQNQIDANRNYGISIGHCDTDNVMRNNVITNSGKIGILFRDDGRGRDFWANRNVLENNQIVNSGGDAGIGIDIRGQTKDIKIIGNELREMRHASSRIGIRIGADAGQVLLTDNQFEGFARPIDDQRNA